MANREQWSAVISNAAAWEKYVSYVTAKDQEIGSFISFQCDDYSPSGSADSPIAGLPFGVKDNIAVEGRKITCASKMLENVVSPYSATAVKKLENAGAVVAGKTNLDEFGMGSSTDNSALCKSNNPWDTTRVCGGSSGGSAAAVAADFVPFALGTDTGGSVRLPASFCGVYGLKPSYGTVSRFGLVAYASSLEGIGVMTKDIDLLSDVFHQIKGKDELDQTSLDFEPPVNADSVKRVGVFKGLSDLHPDVEKTYTRTIGELKKLGYEVLEFEFPEMEYVVPAYYTIATAEASANLARFNGVRYGYRPAYSENPDDLMRASREESFGEEVKLRILLGTYVLRSGFQDQYYLRAQKIRTLLKNRISDIFGSVDTIFLPVFPVPPFTHGEDGMTQFQQKLADKFTSLANLTGVPALSVPIAVENGLPIGMQFMAPAFCEERLFSLAESLAGPFPVQDPPKFHMEWS
ncbi:MAG: Asp-tRNA(Asn)/Glu-tRNA(Gln) amidotransferase subunit GatA [Spirochaetia bacterium]